MFTRGWRGESDLRRSMIARSRLAVTAGGRRPCGACRVIAAVITSDHEALAGAMAEIDTRAAD
jgi:hypothetical protein